MNNDSSRGDSPARDEGLHTAAGARPQMLVPQTAHRILCQRTGGTITRSTFYRWVASGKVPSIRLGSRIFIPRPALDALVQKCFEVD